MVMIMGGAGVTHFTNPGFYEAIVPSWLPGSKRFWVQASGVAELACTALLIPRRTRRAGGWLTAATLLSVWPANIQVAIDGGVEDAEGPLNSATAAWLRLPLQLPMIFDAVKIARHPGGDSGAQCGMGCRGREWLPEQTSRVLVADLGDPVGRECAEDVVEELLAVGPGAVAVRVVGLEHDVVDADGVTRGDRRRVVDRAEPEVAVQHLGRSQTGALPSVPGAVDEVLEPVVEHRDPADPAFAHRDLQLGMAHAALRPQPLRARRERELAEQRRRELLDRRARREVGDAARPGVQADHGAGLRARREDRIPPGREDRLHADAVRLLGQRDRGEPARRVAPDLRRALLGVGEVGDAHRDDPVGMRRVPLVEEPVVPRASPRARAPDPSSARTPSRRSR